MSAAVLLYVLVAWTATRRRRDRTIYISPPHIDVDTFATEMERAKRLRRLGDAR